MLTVARYGVRIIILKVKERTFGFILPMHNQRFELLTT
jgi:hypothetical protein